MNIEIANMYWSAEGTYWVCNYCREQHFGRPSDGCFWRWCPSCGSSSKPKYLLDLEKLHYALEQSVQLQSHYAFLLNSYDDGKRLTFKDAQEWLARLDQLATGGS